MNEIYDNGSSILGGIKNVKEKLYNDGLTCIGFGGFTNKEFKELIAKLEELERIDNNMIICINYANGGYMNFDAHYWTSIDVVKGGKE